MALAAPVDAKKAAMVANNFWMAKSGSKVAPALEYRGGEWEYGDIHLFTNPEGGFVMVSGNDAATPILGYSLSGTMEPKGLPSGLSWWLQCYQLELEWLDSNGSKASAGTARQWAELLDGTFMDDTKEVGVEPLLATLWSQDEPYNDLCPGEGSNKAVVGCAATAQAMLMKYWNFPAIGFGRSSYVDNRYGRLNAEYGHTIYDWAHMTDSYTLSSTAEERHAVAELMYHIGVSLEMVYGTPSDGGSGAMGLVGIPGYPSIDNSLMYYYHYSDAMQVVDRGYYTSEEWREMLMDDLDKRHPILYTGADREGGHAFICDGYDSQRKLHFNFGWAGNGDGFYSVDSISPLQGGVGGNGTYTFNMHNMALINAVPDYDILVGSDLLYYGREGAADSMLYAAIDTSDAPLSISCDVEWLRLEKDGDRLGWLHIEVDDNNTGVERMADVVFRQGTTTRVVRVGQAYHHQEDFCPVTVELRSTGVPGWRGNAYLTLESMSGHEFARLKLDNGTEKTVTVEVDPSELHVVWHPGGRNDRMAAYKVINHYGETLVEVGNALEEGGEAIVMWPCGHVGIDASPDKAVAIYPNPASSQLHIEAEGLQKVEIMDLCGRVLTTGFKNQIDVSQLPAGLYLVRVTTGQDVLLDRLVKQ